MKLDSCKKNSCMKYSFIKFMLKIPEPIIIKSENEEQNCHGKILEKSQRTFAGAARCHVSINLSQHEGEETPTRPFRRGAGLFFV